MVERVAEAHAAGSWPSALRRGGVALAFVALLLGATALPRHPYSATSHDLSSHATFEFYAAQGFQFGIQVVQNVGPYGYVHYSSTFADMLTERKVALHLAFRAALVLMWLCALRTLTPRRPLWAAWAAAWVLLLGSLGPDYAGNEVLDYLTVYLAALTLGASASWVAAAGAAAVLAFAALMKHSLLVVATTGVAAAATRDLLLGERGSAVRSALFYLGALSVLWVLAGQRVSGMPAFVRGVFAFGGGYNDAMATPTSTRDLAVGLGAVALWLGAVALRWLLVDGWRHGWPRAAFDVLVVYAIWKHAFVRADLGHTPILFGAVLVLVIPCCAPVVLREASTAWQRSLGLAVIGVAMSGYVGWAVAAGLPPLDPGQLLASARSNATFLWEPRRQVERLRRELTAERILADLPRVRTQVGDATIDQFGMEPGWILLNDLSYAPRPMPITFAAANSFLQRANEEYYTDPARAPRFVLLRYQRLDDHLTAADDALAYRAILQHYHPLLVESGNLLLARNDAAAEEPAERGEEVERLVRLGEELELDDPGPGYVWLEIDLRRTWLGALVSALYKVPPCALTYTVAGNPGLHQRGRIMTAAASTGFLLSPMISDPVLDTLMLYGAEARDPARVRSFSIGCAGAAGRYYRAAATIRMRSLAPPAPTSVSVVASPEPLPDSAFRVEWLRVAVPPVLTPGQRVRVPVALKNVSDQSWPDPRTAHPSATGARAVRLSSRWWDADHSAPLGDWGPRADLTAPLQPGGAVTLGLSVVAPQRPGRYLLEIGLVEELVVWFQDRGAPELLLPVEVR